jgi:hypothetical protein
MSFRVVDVSKRSATHQSVEGARYLETAVNTFAVLFAAVIALISLGYTFLAYPQADDLERTAAERVIPPLLRIHQDYMAITGRWAAELIEYSTYIGGHVIGRYPVMLTICLLLGAVACCCVIALVTGRRISERSVLAGGVVAYSFLWLSAWRGETFYWFPADVEYWVPIALGMVLLWLLSNFSGWSVKTLAVAMAFVLPAIHEVFGSWIVGVLAVRWIVQFARRKPGRDTTAAAIVAGVLGEASVVFAPGIRARAASNPHQPLPDALNNAFHIERLLFAHWPVMLAIFIVILLAAARLRVRPSWYDDAPLFIKTCLLVAVVPLPVLMLTAISYGLGGGIPARVYDGFYFLQAAAIGTFAAVCGFDLRRSNVAKAFLDSPRGSFLRSAVMMLALAGAISLPRFHAAFHDIDPAIRNRAVWVQRNEEIWTERNEGVRDVVVSQHMLPLTMLPFYFDMTEDPNFYANQHLRTYYGVNSIRLSPMLDKVLPGPPIQVSETAPVDCELGIDSINGVSPATPPSVISNRLTVGGWVLISGKYGIVPDEVFLTLSNASQKLYITPHTVTRPDVNRAFHHPDMPDSGFTATVDISDLSGQYVLGLSRVYKGKLDSCNQLRIPLLIRR